MPSPRIRVGLSGWQYDAWRGDFYPERLAKRSWLEYAAAQFPTIELNGSFYALQRPSRYRRWAASVPDDFVFAVKGGRYLTHMLRLRGARTALANFFASGVLELGTHLGPLLWQLPDGFAPDPDLLDEFCAALPRSFGAARALAADHDDKVHLDEVATEDPRSGGSGSARPAPPVSESQPDTAPIRHALEVRDPRAVTPEHLAVLRAHAVTLVDSHAEPEWPRFVADTGTDLAYLRLHGAPNVYHDGYSAQALARWATRIEEHVDAGRDVVVYFDNDAELHAPWDALHLMRILEARRFRG
jgi:uncharacterized protein YecE (DUF72 family)